MAPGASARDTSQDAVFASAFEAMDKLIGSDASFRAEFAAATGVNLARLESAYPRATWEKGLPIAARRLFPALPRDEALYALGQKTIDRYKEGVIGLALFALLRVIGPMRALARTRRNFRTANNYTECRLTVRGPKEVLMWMNELDFRAYTAGVVQAGTALTGAKNVKVEVQGVEGDGTNFLVTWE
ncbi:MAG: DUF2378 family protein [Archangium sp.]|nr:DUF2378 family protein [Archangium sp.]